MPEPVLDQHNLMTVKEAAAYLRIPLPTVYYLAQRGSLPAVQIGGRWRIKRDLLDRDVLQAERKRSVNVLVVDDDPSIHATFKDFLRRSRVASTLVEDGKAALTALNTQRFDLCFLDLQLPDITGDEIYAVAKRQQPDLPIVIITGYPDSAMLDSILRHGPVTVLRKPLQLAQLQEAMKMLGAKPKAVAKITQMAEA